MNKFLVVAGACKQLNFIRVSCSHQSILTHVSPRHLWGSEILKVVDIHWSDASTVLGTFEGTPQQEKFVWTFDSNSANHGR